VIGTSTGGIIAIGLGLKKSPSQLADLYLKEGRKIFSATGWRFLPPVIGLLTNINPIA
jgi:patatin-like phospholipase/acyl hydrolase